MSKDADVTIEFKGRHDHITERMQEHATKKLQRLGHFGDALTRVEVVADHAHENPEVELIAHLRKGAPLVATAPEDPASVVYFDVARTLVERLR